MYISRNITVNHVSECVYTLSYQPNCTRLKLLNRTLGNSNLNIFWQYFRPTISISVVLNNFIKKMIYNEV